MDPSIARELLTAPIGMQLLELVSTMDVADLTDEELERLLFHAGREVSPHRGDYGDHLARLKGRVAALQDLAEWLSQRMSHWWQAQDRSQQVWLAPDARAPEAVRMVVDLSRFSAEASKPKRAFWTSTLAPGLLSPWLHWRQFGEDPVPGPYRLWKVGVLPSARIAEISSPADWSDLAQRYPAPSDRRLDPDWRLVARDFDGVHLSAGGLLTAQRVSNPAQGAITELRGWDMESTAWFTWSFTSVEALAIVQ